MIQDKKKKIKEREKGKVMYGWSTLTGYWDEGGY